MKNEQFIYISIKLINNSFVAVIALEDIMKVDKDLELLLNKISSIYSVQILKCRDILNDINKIKSSKQIIPARKVWDWGNEIFKLIYSLEKINIKINNLYYHLSRDLNVKKKRLEKVIILRRYIDRVNNIPERISWGYFEHSTKRKATQFSKKLQKETGI